MAAPGPVRDSSRILENLEKPLKMRAFIPTEKQRVVQARPFSTVLLGLGGENGGGDGAERPERPTRCEPIARDNGTPDASFAESGGADLRMDPDNREEERRNENSQDTDSAS